MGVDRGKNTPFSEVFLAEPVPILGILLEEEEDAL